MSLTQTERRSLGCFCTRLDGVWHHQRKCPVPTVETILIARSDKAVLRAARFAVQGLSAKARQRLAEGAYYVRLSAHDAKRLIEAVDQHDSKGDE